jgi:hypothetical protein
VKAGSRLGERLSDDETAALLERIEAFIAEHGLTDSGFGVDAYNNTALVGSMRRGEARLMTFQRDRIEAYMRDGKR